MSTDLRGRSQRLVREARRAPPGCSSTATTTTARSTRRRRRAAIHPALGLAVRQRRRAAPRGGGGALRPLPVTLLELPGRAVRAATPSCTSTSWPGTSTWCSRSSASGCRSCVFDWTTNERLHFRFDSSHVEAAATTRSSWSSTASCRSSAASTSATTAGTTAVTWTTNPLRVSRGEPHKPFHDVQAYLVGREVGGARSPSSSTCRWKRAGGEHITRAPVRTTTPSAPTTTPQGARAARGQTRVALSRTDPQGSPTVDARGCREIATLYVDAHRRRRAPHLHRDAVLQLARHRRGARAQRLRAPGARARRRARPQHAGRDAEGGDRRRPRAGQGRSPTCAPPPRARRTARHLLHGAGQRRRASPSARRTSTRS